MKDKSSVLIYVDEDTQPIGEFSVPMNFNLDTTALCGGEHTLKIVSKDPNGKQGIRKIPFVVRNGPAIAVEGITEHEEVDGIVPIMVNAYGKGDQRKFLIEGSETPRSIPSIFYAGILVFFAWAVYYLIQNN